MKTIERRLEEYVKEAYLDYSMYVILDRALPKLGDGLKPVQRRILFAMRELGVTHTSEFKKSARTVGDVIGKFHPHGDSAAYEAMVLMAQPFSTRYPLIQGQGNFGSIDDPKSFAAMRYTEARLTPYSQTLLSELGEGTVDFAPNFDGTIPEPLILPARLPHLLLNGTTGIAVGMATDIPSHNLGEVVDACCRVLEKSSITLDEILKLLPAPDFAGGGLIVNSAEELRQIYSTGRGSVRVQSRWRLEAPDEVAIYEIPPHISSNRLLEQLAKTVLDKKVTGIIDVRDEGDEDHPVYLKLILKPSTKNVDQIMAQLFQYTDLEKSVRINFNVINAEGYTRVLPLVDFIKQWLDGRFEVVTRRYTYRQQQAQARHHRLSGFLIAHKHIDRIIEIIRNNDTPSPIIQKEFKLSEEQTSAILDLRLRQLAKLEKTKMQEEVDALEAELKEIESLLNSPRKLKSRIKSELKKDKKEFGDPRRTVWEPQGKASIKLAVPVDKTKYTLLLSRGGWLRVLKGHLELTQENAFRGDDALLQALYTSGQEWVHFLDSEGRVYSIRAARLRETDKTDRKGVPITRWFTPTSGATFCGMCTISDPGKQNILLVTEKAKGMLIDANVPEGMRKAGKNRLNLASGDKPLNLFAVNPSLSDEIAMLVSGGRLILLEANDIPVRNIGQGVTLTKIVTELQKQKDLLGPGDADIEKLLDIAVVTGKEKCLKVKTVRSFQRFRAEGLIPFRRNRGQRPVSLPPRLKNALAIENDPAPDSS